MAYVLQRADALIEALRGVALEQIDIALDAVYDSARPAALRIHRVRVCCKRLRGLVRLVESGLAAGIKREEKLARSAARRLASHRDARVLLETHRLVVDELPRADANGLALLGDRLAQSVFELENSETFMTRLQDAAADLETLWETAAGWSLDGKAAKILSRGYALTYKRALRAGRMAEERKDASSYHRWRAQVKYHHFHTRLLDSAWPLAMAARAHTAEDLSECLGRGNDLARYVEFLVSAGVAPDLADTLKARAREEQARQWTQATALGQRLFHQSPKVLRKDMRELWRLAKVRPAG